MPRPFHLSCRNGWYYLRIRIPRDLTRLFGRQEICKSLKTRDKGLAQNLLKIYLVQANNIFLLARTGMLTPQFQNAAESSAQSFHQVCELLKCTDDMGPLLRAPEMSDLTDMVNKYQLALANRDYSLVHPEAKMICDERHLPYNPASTQFKLFCRELLKSRIQSCQREIMHLNGIYGQPVATIIPPPQVDNNQKLDQILSLVTTPPKPHFSAVMEEYLAEKLEVDRMDAWVIKEYRGQLEFIMRIIGNKPMDKYERSDFLQASKIIRQLPANVNQVRALKGMDIKDILAQGEADNPFAERTVLKILNHMNSLFKFAAKKDHIRKSLCPAWKKSDELEDDEGWAPFDQQDLERFFATSYFVRTYVRKKNPENFWTAPIALYSGMRLGEISQLYVEDIRQIDDIWCFDINRKNDKRVKSTHSKRLVPVHDFLLKMGFLDYVKSVNHERLWPNLKWTEKAGYSKDIGNRMQKNIRRNVTEDEDKVFHSFRNTFAVRLNKDKKELDENIACILGHEDQYKITVKYRGMKPTEVLSMIVNNFDPGVDLSHLL